MWLLKKFWHADILNKIYILIILFVVVVATITVITRYRNVGKEKQTEKLENDVVQELIEDKNVEEDAINVTNTDINQVKESKEEVKQENKTNQSKSEEKNTNKIARTTNKTDNIMPQSTQKTQDEIKDNVKEKTKENSVEDNNSNDNQGIQQEQKEEVLKEEYKENKSMINTMKNFIQNNPSEDMITYGFEIVVDSSIVETTSQFTYTEQRMTNFLKHRCGTIRIYARDYYFNGNLVMTECYII